MKFRRKRRGSGEVITDIADQVYFTVKRFKTDKKAVLLKYLGKGITYDYENGWYHLEIQPEDTDKMDFSAEYYYDIEIRKGKYRFTPVRGSFTLGWETTHGESEAENE